MYKLKMINQIVFTLVSDNLLDIDGSDNTSGIRERGSLGMKIQFYKQK